MFSIGVIVDSLGLDLKAGIIKAGELGADGIQMYAVQGELEPSRLTYEKRRELLKYIKDNGVKISALCGDFGGHGFSIKEDNKCKMEKSKRIIDLAKDLETNIVTTHIGVVPEDFNSERYKILQEACNSLGEYAEEYDAYFAIETGPEKPETLKKFLDTLDNKHVAVNYDPANLVMVTGTDPVEGVYTLKDYIVHTHAKDGIMLKKTDPQVVYNCLAENDIKNVTQYFREVPLGDGQVDFTRYLKALEDIGYHGFLTIEREVSNKPEIDISEAIGFLKKIIM